FIVAQNHCATIAICHRISIPGTGSQNAAPQNSISFRPILVESEILATQTSQIQSEDNNTESSLAPTGLEIVPWRPCVPSTVLQLWPGVVDARRQKRRHQARLPFQTASSGDQETS